MNFHHIIFIYSDSLPPLGDYLNNEWPLITNKLTFDNFSTDYIEIMKNVKKIIVQVKGQILRGLMIAILAPHPHQKDSLNNSDIVHAKNMTLISLTF